MTTDDIKREGIRSTETYSSMLYDAYVYCARMEREGECVDLEDCEDAILDAHGAWLDQATESDLFHAALTARGHAYDHYTECLMQALDESERSLRVSGYALEHYELIRRALDLFAHLVATLAAEDALRDSQ